MLASAEVIHAVADTLEAYRPRHVVLDPVMAATSGARLLEADAPDALRTRLLPMATVLTPNTPQAELLLRLPIHDGAAADQPVLAQRALGARGELLKDGHRPDGTTT